ncbi:MAG TPA: hypothetical protein VMV56_03540 [Williamwhitmania sp.]|nr:hypothetical protein [Williamwhitmania sp.]
MIRPHSFHIPVMGIAYTLDTPLRVSPFGIDSVISLVDDILIEQMRKFYCSKYAIAYQEITDKIEDFRAKRISSYLNLINTIAEKKLEELKNVTLEKKQGIKDYFSMLPDSSSIKQEFKKRTAKYFNVDEIKAWLKENLSLGSIDVNIMTKVDKDNYKNGEKLPVEFNDAHAALRGFATSNLHSSIILSAGMNPRLFNYMEQFEDFYPNESGEMKKKIVLKVSDYRSALIQGKVLAKKGLWVSEYRVESGLNCGGHAFATDGFLMGPILAEFRDKRQELIQAMQEVFVKALTDKNHTIPKAPLPLRVTAQGGVGTAEEHEFLIEHYNLDSVGWGTPFLLVPEVVTIDDNTLNQLADAKEDDLFLSNISPLGVPFNSLRGNTKDLERLSYISQGKPGSPCPKQFIALNNEFTEKGICTASRRYQTQKLEELNKEGLSPEDYKPRFNKIVEKSCLCVGLGTSALLVNNLSTKVEGVGVSVCPGPNMAYFSKKMSLANITDHIYGRANMITRTDRPNMFVNELRIYIDYLKARIEEARASMNNKQGNHLLAFEKNLQEGIEYYSNLFSGLKEQFKSTKQNILNDLESSKKVLLQMHAELEKLMSVQ